MTTERKTPARSVPAISIAVREAQAAFKFRPFPNYDMTVLKPRSRSISIRLSEEEYSALRVHCSLTGARSVSDLTRDAMRAFLNGTSRETALGGHLESWLAHISNLDAKIEQLASELNALKTNPTN